MLRSLQELRHCASSIVCQLNDRIILNGTVGSAPRAAPITAALQSSSSDPVTYQCGPSYAQNDLTCRFHASTGTPETASQASCRAFSNPPWVVFPTWFGVPASPRGVPPSSLGLQPRTVVWEGSPGKSWGPGDSTGSPQGIQGTLRERRRSAALPERIPEAPWRYRDTTLSSRLPAAPHWEHAATTGYPIELAAFLSEFTGIVPPPKATAASNAASRPRMHLSARLPGYSPGYRAPGPSASGASGREEGPLNRPWAAAGLRAPIWSPRASAGSASGLVPPEEPPSYRVSPCVSELLDSSVGLRSAAPLAIKCEPEVVCEEIEDTHKGRPGERLAEEPPGGTRGVLPVGDSLGGKAWQAGRSRAPQLVETTFGGQPRLRDSQAPPVGRPLALTRGRQHRGVPGLPGGLAELLWDREVSEQAPLSRDPPGHAPWDKRGPLEGPEALGTGGSPWGLAMPWAGSQTSWDRTGPRGGPEGLGAGENLRGLSPSHVTAGEPFGGEPLVSHLSRAVEGFQEVLFVQAGGQTSCYEWVDVVDHRKPALEEEEEEGTSALEWAGPRAVAQGQEGSWVPGGLWADSVRRKRKRKMNKHKHRKRRKKLRHKT
eukprot:jgi/Botrbrau1/7575/Bobra.0159s0024.1